MPPGAGTRDPAPPAPQRVPQGGSNDVHHGFMIPHPPRSDMQQMLIAARAAAAGRLAAWDVA